MKIKEFHIVLGLLLLNIFGTIFTIYFDPGGLNPGTIRGGIASLFIIYFFIRRFESSSVNIFITLYIFYFGILVLTSSDIYKSFYQYVGFSIGLLMFPIGYYYINTREKLYSVCKVLLSILIVVIVNIIIVNLLGVGESDYLDKSIRFGGGSVNITKVIIVIIFTSPVLFIDAKKPMYRILAILIYLIGLIICLVGIKRSVLLSMIIGSGVYLWFSPSLLRTVKYYIGAALLLVLLSPFFIDTFTERFEAREGRVAISEETVETEARYFETLRVVDAIANHGWKHRLIGSEPFNDTNYFNTQRMLHIDYNIILNGSGIIGLVGWFVMFLLIIYQKNKYFRYLKNASYFKTLNAVFWTLITIQMLLSISGTVYSITLLSYVFIMLGGIIGVMRDSYKELKYGK